MKLLIWFQVADLGDMNPLTYLSPFLDVIKAQNTNGPITEAALSSVAKFLSYGLIDANRWEKSLVLDQPIHDIFMNVFVIWVSLGPIQGDSFAKVFLI